MPGQLTNFQNVGVTAWRGTVTKDNHLYNTFRMNPQMASDIMTVLISAMHLPTIDTYLSNEVPVREFEDDTRIFWDVLTSSNRNIPLIEARRCDGTPVTSADADNVGVGFEPFYLVFPTDWFALGEVIWGNLNEVYPIIIKEAGKAEGTNTVYLCETFGAAGADGIPVNRLLAGERFSWGYAPVEKDFSRKVGDVRFFAPVSMSQEWSRIRLQHKIGGRELGKRLCCRIPIQKEVNGKLQQTTVDRWIYNVTWKIEETWSKYKSNVLERGVSTQMENGEFSNFGISGLPNEQGAGFKQLLQMGNVSYYNKFSIALIEDALFNLSEGKLDFKNRKFVMRTGERGLRQFSQAAKKEMSGWIPIYSANAPSYLSKGPETNFTNGNAATIADLQVTRWLAANGVELTVMIDSSKDDKETNKLMHPNGGTAESYVYEIFYAADEEQPNIQKCVVKGQPELRGYQWGPFSNPFTGETNNPYASFDEDAAVVHYKATLGILMKDPLRCISIIPAILQA